VLTVGLSLCSGVSDAALAAASAAAPVLGGGGDIRRFPACGPLRRGTPSFHIQKKCRPSLDYVTDEGSTGKWTDMTARPSQVSPHYDMKPHGLRITSSLRNISQTGDRNVSLGPTLQTYA
jgi:hypothetical protein